MIATMINAHKTVHSAVPSVRVLNATVPARQCKPIMNRLFKRKAMLVKIKAAFLYF
jgi:hypothetical protein